MNILYFDLETTGINPYTAEIITGYFELHTDQSSNSFFLQSQVNQWSHEAEMIHGISQVEMRGFPAKKQALDGLVAFLSSAMPFDCCLYANPKTPLGYLFYDVAVLQMELMDHCGVDRLEKQPFTPMNIINVYDMAKDAAKKEYFEPIRGESGRASFTMENVYKAIFNDSYKAHDCFEDVRAMIQIKDFIDSGQSNKKQMELI